jgi:hypothetical protein
VAPGKAEGVGKAPELPLRQYGRRGWQRQSWATGFRKSKGSAISDMGEFRVRMTGKARRSALFLCRARPFPAAL